MARSQQRAARRSRVSRSGSRGPGARGGGRHDRRRAYTGSACSGPGGAGPSAAPGRLRVLRAAHLTGRLHRAPQTDCGCRVPGRSQLPDVRRRSIRARALHGCRCDARRQADLADAGRPMVGLRLSPPICIRHSRPAVAAVTTMGSPATSSSSCADHRPPGGITSRTSKPRGTRPSCCVRSPMREPRPAPSASSGRAG